MKPVAIYDTTLRDGTQSKEINLTTEDKIRIAIKLDELGVRYIEGGWPGSNPTDRQFFKEIVNYTLKEASIAAFGATHNPKTTPEADKNLKSLLDAGAPVVTLFGKTWDFHVKEALKTTLERNLELISGSLGFIRGAVEELFFDAEHFFDGYKANPDYAVAALQTAHEAGADVLVLCDTNGGTLPCDIASIMETVREKLPEARFGIHAHNDSELAVANSLAGVRAGAIQIQGTVNGYGERCGNANLCSIIPNLEFKMGIETIGRERLEKLTRISNYVAEICNMRPFLRQPFVGQDAFAHKGGIHVSAVLKDAATYEHLNPGSVGNKRKVLLSDLSGSSNILFKAREYGYPSLSKDDPAVKELLNTIKQREMMGYEYSVAEASFELLFFQTMGWSKKYFQFQNFFVVDAKREGDREPFSEATVIVKVGGAEEHTAATGDGPVNALDRALRRALERFYPGIDKVKLLDFKVRVLSGALRDTGGTSSMVRVLIESGDGIDRWTTMGVSANIIEASWRALVDSYNYKFFKDDPQKWPNQSA